MDVGLRVLHPNLPWISITSCNTVSNNMTKGTKRRRGIRQISKCGFCMLLYHPSKEFSLKSWHPSFPILSCDKFSFFFMNPELFHGDSCLSIQCHAGRSPVVLRTPAGEELLHPGSMGYSKWGTDGQCDGIGVLFWRAMELERSWSKLWNRLE